MSKEEPEKDRVVYSLNTTETILNVLRNNLNENDDLKIAFIHTPSLFFSTCTDKKLFPKCFLFDHSVVAPKSSPLQIEHFFYTDVISEQYEKKFSIIIVEPSFISKECIQKYVEVMKFIGKTHCKIILMNIIENEEHLSDLNLKSRKFLPSISNIVYQYSIFTNFECEEFDKKNNEILNFEEQKLKFVDEVKYKAVKKKKIQDLREIKKIVKKHKVKNQNAKFYQNKISSLPHGDKIDNIHKSWWGNYNLLEYHHGYIQWLFPYCEGGGMNYYSEKLNKEEISEFNEDKVMQDRLVKSYELILDFYGFELKNKETGEVGRHKKWEDRFRCFTYHNNLRITRILKCFNDVKFMKKYVKPFVMNMVKQIIHEDQLPMCFNSLMSFWIPQLESEDQVKLKMKLDESGVLEKYMKKHQKIKRKFLGKRVRFKLTKGRSGIGSKKEGKKTKGGSKRERIGIKDFMKNKKKVQKKDPFENFMVTRK